MALDRKKKQKRLPNWSQAGDKKPFVHEKLFKPGEDETLLIHKNTFKIK